MFRRLGVASVAALLAVSLAAGSSSADLTEEFTPGACITQAVQTTPFVDVEPNRFYSNPVGWAFLNGITTGTDETHFSPDAPVTRAQFATFLHRMLCEPAAGGTAPFSDLVDGAFYEAAVDWLWANGFTSGKPGNVYDPGGLLTRGELATFLFRLIGEPAGAPVNPFGDVDRALFYALPIDWLFDRGITTGTSATAFSPDATVTRAQAVTFLYRLNIGAAGLIDPSTLDLGLATVLSGLSGPTAAAIHPTDGSVYITEQDGRLVRVPGKGSGDPDWGAGFTDITPGGGLPVVSGGERGLLGVAVSPDAARLYLSFTTTRSAGTDCRGGAFDNDSVVWEYDLIGGVPTGAARELLRIPQHSPNHNGGHLVFGPDGYLYATFGDGGGGGDPCGLGQDTSTILGSIIRIAPTGAGGYTIPADNPFVGEAGAAEEIYLYGVRNPWKFSFDSFTDDLWVADVGQDTREEITRLEDRLGRGNGANLGWNIYEGTVPFGPVDPRIDHVGPIYEYQTSGPEGRSITGGFVYRGTDIVGLDGTYLWADFFEPELRGWNGDWGGAISYGVNVPGGFVVAFLQDLDGEVYAISRAGSVSRIVAG